MLEWLKRHAWKACKLQKGFGGSNPPLSAEEDNNEQNNINNLILKTKSYEKSFCNPYGARNAYYW